jgi:NDP-sugar pyrophosphorylase family protein
MFAMLEKRLPVRAHVFEGLWLDIGRPEDYSQATDLLAGNRALLLPDDAPTASQRREA